jgi:hypothetical protein
METVSQFVAGDFTQLRISSRGASALLMVHAVGPA